MVSSRRFPTCFGIDGHLRSESFLTGFGSDQNNTGSGFGTIDSGSGGILKDGHGLDIIGIYTGEFHLYTIHQHQRLGGRRIVYRSQTTNIKVVGGTRSAGVHGDVERRVGALQGCDHIRCRTPDDVL